MSSTTPTRRRPNGRSRGDRDAAHTPPRTPPTGQARRDSGPAHAAVLGLAAALLAACGGTDTAASDAAAASSLNAMSARATCRDHLGDQFELADELARAVADPTTKRKAAKQRADRFSAAADATVDPDLGLACAAAIAYLKQAAERYQNGIAAWRNCGADCGATISAWADGADIVAKADAAIAIAPAATT